MQVEAAETMPEGWRRWLNWHRAIALDNAIEINALESDAGRFMGYVRVVGRRRERVPLDEHCWPDALKTAVPPQYTAKPLLRDQER